MIAWLDGEPRAAADAVRRALGSEPRMSWINAAEVYYRTEREHGRPLADQVLASMRNRIRLELPDEHRMIEVARLEARLSIALGDCFAIATAAAHDEVLLTGDPEILAARDLPCRTRDVRARRGRRR